MTKYTISTDNAVDFYKSFLEEKNIYHIPLKRISEGKEYAEFYDSVEEYEKFYENQKKGVLSSTSQINPDEFIEHFNNILEKEKTGDIIHVSMSGALSGTFSSAVSAANELNKTLKGRKIYAFDSLGVCPGMQLQINKLMELNGKVTAEKAIAEITQVRDNTHTFFLVDDLFHLKRGGRVSAAKEIIG
jgi:DegV family protein with EDD domain